MPDCEFLPLLWVAGFQGFCGLQWMCTGTKPIKRQQSSLFALAFSFFPPFCWNKCCVNLCKLLVSIQHPEKCFWQFLLVLLLIFRCPHCHFYWCTVDFIISFSNDIYISFTYCLLCINIIPLYIEPVCLKTVWFYLTPPVFLSLLSFISIYWCKTRVLYHIYFIHHFYNKSRKTNFSLLYLGIYTFLECYYSFRFKFLSNPVFVYPDEICLVFLIAQSAGKMLSFFIFWFVLHFWKIFSSSRLLAFFF